MSAVTLIFSGQFTASKVGKTGLTPTPYLWSLTRANPPVASVVSMSGITVTEVGRGVYSFAKTGLDPRTYDYVGSLVTSDATVDLKEVATQWSEFSPSAFVALNDAAPEAGTGVPTAAQVLALAPGSATNVEIETTEITG